MRTRGIHVHVYILFVTADETRVLLLDENQGNTATSPHRLQYSYANIMQTGLPSGDLALV